MLGFDFVNNQSTFVFQAENSRAGPPETPASTAAARRSIFAPKARDDLVILLVLMRHVELLE